MKQNIIAGNFLVIIHHASSFVLEQLSLKIQTQLFHFQPVFKELFLLTFPEECKILPVLLQSSR
jgi:hypothetical protein